MVNPLTPSGIIPNLSYLADLCNRLHTVEVGGRGRGSTRAKDRGRAGGKKKGGKNEPIGGKCGKDKKKYSIGKSIILIAITVRLVGSYCPCPPIWLVFRLIYWLGRVYSGNLGAA